MIKNTQQALSLNKLAINLASDMKLTEAVQLLLQAASLCPSLAATHQNLGAVQMMRNETTEALNCFLRAIKFDSKHVGAHFNLANIYRGLGMTKEAISHLKIVVALDPAHHSAGHLLSATTGKTPDQAPLRYVQSYLTNILAILNTRWLRILNIKFPHY